MRQQHLTQRPHNITFIAKCQMPNLIISKLKRFYPSLFSNNTMDPPQIGHPLHGNILRIDWILNDDGNVGEKYAVMQFRIKLEWNGTKGFRI